MKVGFTIGKFAPFHKGHEFLINKAINEMDEFYVVVYDTPEYNISMEEKTKWIKNKFPTVKLLYAYDSPKKYGLDEKSVKIQMDYLSKIIKDIPINFFYSSEEYGKYVAKYLKISNVIVDKQRLQYPISATLVRENVIKYKKFLNSEVFEFLDGEF